MDKKEKLLKEIVRQAVDLHVHVGPEVMPRKYTLEQLVKSETGKLGGVAVKSHYFPTTPFIRELKDVSKKFKIIGSVTLNNSVGGLNAEAVKSAAAISENPVIVWFPTTSAQNYLNKSEYEIRPEWVLGTAYKSRLSKDVRGIQILENRRLVPEALGVLKVIKDLNLILATGHVSWEEAKILVTTANKIGIRKTILTHPIYQLIDMPIRVQSELANLGALIEICYSMYSIDNIGIKKIMGPIRTIGPKYFILSSDVGQPASPSPSQALLEFSKLLSKGGLGGQELYQMMVVNPNKIIA